VARTGYISGTSHSNHLLIPTAEPARFRAGFFVLIAFQLHQFDSKLTAFPICTSTSMGEPFVAGHGAPFDSPEAPTEQDEPPIGVFGAHAGGSPPEGTPLPSPPPHCLSGSDLRLLLGTDQDNGLSGDEAARRRVRDGPNRIEGAKGLSMWNIALKQISNSLTLVLVIVMILSISIKDYIEGGVVAAVILLNIVVG
jgi:hypothetical protein